MWPSRWRLKRRSVWMSGSSSMTRMRGIAVVGSCLLGGVGAWPPQQSRIFAGELFVVMADVGALVDVHRLLGDGDRDVGDVLQLRGGTQQVGVLADAVGV